ncbi:MAG: hypothetical protein ACRCYC_03295 [Paraclostridium sp.]|uniref:hypothetical protein n=1 Tax=Paraclostridium sp. TaxID=2023273 RepID=UPI003042D479
MAKKRKVKKSMVILIGVIAFFIVYAGTYIHFSKEQESDQPIKVEDTSTKDDSRPLLSQLKTNDTVYISDENLQDVRIDQEYWEQIKFFSTKFKEVRKPSSYDGTYEGYLDNGIRFSTDLDYFRIYTVSREEFYKIPVSEKKAFDKLLQESIYTSIDSVKKYKTWDSVEIIYGDQVKKPWRWSYDDLAYKISVKRLVGKIQPEKSKERSPYNFTIKIKGDGYSINLETMGKDYVKVTSDKATAYYEVHEGLFEYLRDDIFKIEKK